jgi:very-short-patch-repair endonuclease
MEADSYDLDRREEDSTLLLHAWPDIEEALLKGEVRGPELAEAVRKAFRVEIEEQREFVDTLGYVLLFDVNSYAARRAAAVVNDRRIWLDVLVDKYAPIQGSRNDVAVRVVPIGKPIGGEVCPRVMAAPPDAADLRDLPEPEPPETSVPLVQRGHHRLTPIEAPFFDALRATGLVFAVQPRVQGPDRMFRPDFTVFYGGQTVVVELDGHEGHKTKEQRIHDSQRQLWFESKGIRVLRWTGSQVYADAEGCVAQLMEILRGERSRP